jgi:hypothetical protein
MQHWVEDHQLKSYVELDSKPSVPGNSCASEVNIMAIYRILGDNLFLYLHCFSGLMNVQKQYAIRAIFFLLLFLYRAACGYVSFYPRNK